MPQFIALIRETWSLLWKRRKAFLIAAFLFGVILLAVQRPIEASIDVQIRRSVITAGIDAGRLAELNRRMEQSDPQAFGEMLEELEKANQRIEAMNEPQRKTFMEATDRSLLSALGPIRLLLPIVSILVLLASGTCFLLLASARDIRLSTLRSLLRTRAVRGFLALTSIILASFLWLPFIVPIVLDRWLSPVLATGLTLSALLPPLFLFPRLSPAFPALIEGTLPIRSALGRSFHASKGHWGGLFLLLSGVIVLLWACSILFTMVAFPIPRVGDLLIAVFGQLEWAFFCVFLFVLGRSVEAQRVVPLQ
ncbi:MAG: hypothetical protein V1926_04390 [Candidatus Peregrinibacteria bacterium]